jgi:hypothetical protein
MKNTSIKVIFVLCIGLSAKAQNIGIGTPTPHASAQLDITAANKGLLIPRMALANRPASPATGLLIYQTNSTPGFYYYDGSSWVALKTTEFSLPYTGSTASNNAFNITSTSGNAIVGISSAASGGWYGGQFTSSSTSGSGVYGAATAASGTTYGGQFVSLSTTGVGIYGEATASTGVNHGGVFKSASTEGYGVKGEATAVTGNTRGGLFNSYSANGVGVYAQNLSLTGSAIGMIGETYSTEGIGVAGSAISTSGNTRGVFGTNYSSDGVGVAGYAFATTGLNYGVSGGSASIQGVGVLGSGTSVTGANTGIAGQSNSPDGVGGSFYNNSSNNALALKTGQGQVQFDALSGSGNRMVVANPSGKLSTQSIPGSQWTTNGNNIYNANSGRVGIGISNPAANLQVNDATEGSTEGNILITNQLSGTSLSDGLRLRMNFLVASIQNNENGDMFFQTNQGATGEYGSPAIWIKPSGAIGIGTSTPGAKLEILGSGSNQAALNINDGFLKVSGTNKTAFTVTGTVANSATYFLYPGYANQSVSDILIVTHNYNPLGGGGTYHTATVGVYWDGTQWSIYSEDQATPMLGKSFNVLVIKQ